jgi:two-component system chemotaxis response regulator CheB
VRKVRVMLVDDSVVIRRLLTDVLSDDPGIEIAATAANGRIALSKIDSVKPDAIVMDIEMPELDGLGALKEIRKRDKQTPIIMFSTLTARGAEATMEALSLGASDYVTKPANMGSVAESRESARTQLVPRILALVRNPTGSPVAPGAARRPVPGAQPVPSGPISLRQVTGAVVQPRVLVIGCSTGGPEALAKLVAQLPANLNVPVLVVQHMPPVFTTMFAERLDRGCPLTVTEAHDNVELRAGHLYLAPGNFHLEVAVTPGARPRYSTKLTSAPPENFCRPAVDVLFRSAAAAFGPAVLASVLTGMGSDGKIGGQAIVEAGGHIVVQDRQTSVVWGMPGAVASAGLAEAVLPLGEIATNLIRRLAADHAPRDRGTASTGDVPAPVATAHTAPATAFPANSAPPARTAVPATTAVPPRKAVPATTAVPPRKAVPATTAVPPRKAVPSTPVYPAKTAVPPRPVSPRPVVPRTATPPVTPSRPPLITPARTQPAVPARTEPPARFS